MANEKENKNNKAHFQNGHRQSNAFGKIDTDVTPDGDGGLETNSTETKKEGAVDKTVDSILKDTKKK